MPQPVSRRTSCWSGPALGGDSVSILSPLPRCPTEVAATHLYVYVPSSSLLCLVWTAFVEETDPSAGCSLAFIIAARLLVLSGHLKRPRSNDGQPASDTRLVSQDNRLHVPQGQEKRGVSGEPAPSRAFGAGVGTASQARAIPCLSMGSLAPLSASAGDPPTGAPDSTVLWRLSATPPVSRWKQNTRPGSRSRDHFQRTGWK